MGILGRIFAPKREATIKLVRETTENETYRVFREHGISEQESEEWAIKLGKDIDRRLRKR